MKNLKIPLSPSDMTETEVKEIREAILSEWIIADPRTKIKSWLQNT